jgi:hypothetical protein
MQIAATTEVTEVVLWEERRQLSLASQPQSTNVPHLRRAGAKRPEVNLEMGITISAMVTAKTEFLATAATRRTMVRRAVAVVAVGGTVAAVGRVAAEAAAARGTAARQRAATCPTPWRPREATAK